MSPDSPTDADQLVRELLAQGSESRVDYKSARPAPSESRPRAELAKHVIGLSNRKDGGYLLIGVEDSTLVPTGLSNDEVESWDAARIHPWLAAFAAPAPVVQVIRGSLEDGKVLVALRVLPAVSRLLAVLADQSSYRALAVSSRDLSAAIWLAELGHFATGWCHVRSRRALPAARHRLGR